jgi:hypothetical protein
MEIKKQSGQSTVEFIVTFACGVSLIFVVFNSALNFATGYLVHYATFVASRSYLTYDTHIGTIGSENPALSGAEDYVRSIYDSYRLNLFGVDNSGFKLNQVLGPVAMSEFLTVGASTSFDQPIDVVGKVAGQKKLELVSESFLGKEPTRATCATRICKAITGSISECSSTSDITLFDDGC